MRNWKMRVRLKLLIHESSKTLCWTAQDYVFREDITGGDEGVAREIPDQFAWTEKRLNCMEKDGYIMLYTRHALMWPRQLDGSRLLVCERHILVLRLYRVLPEDCTTRIFLVDRIWSLGARESFNKLIWDELKTTLGENLRIWPNIFHSDNLKTQLKIYLKI